MKDEGTECLQCSLTRSKADVDLFCLGRVVVAMVTESNNAQLVGLSVCQAAHIDMAVLRLRLSTIPLLGTCQRMHTYTHTHV